MLHISDNENQISVAYVKKQGREGNILSNTRKQTCYISILARKRYYIEKSNHTMSCNINPTFLELFLC